VVIAREVIGARATGVVEELAIVGVVVHKARDPVVARVGERRRGAEGPPEADGPYSLRDEGLPGIDDSDIRRHLSLDQGPLLVGGEIARRLDRPAAEVLRRLGQGWAGAQQEQDEQQRAYPMS